MTLPKSTVVITGSTRGLGLATARALGARGCRLVVSSRHHAAVTAAVALLHGEGVEAVGVVADVAERASVEALATAAEDRFGPIDVWINNAAASAPYGPTLAIAPETFEAVTRTNVLGTYNGSQVAARRFLAQRRGILVNLLGRGERGAVPMQSAYGASKAWVRAFSLALAEETKGTGMAVLLFHPGLMLTDLVLRPEVVAGRAGALQGFARVLRLWGSPPEVAAEALVRFLEGSAGRTGAIGRAHGLPWMALGPLRALLGGAKVPHLEVHEVPGAEVASRC